MSSETQFATSHSNFWNSLLPMGEGYIRAQNADPSTFAPRITTSVPPDHRGAVNEAAFLIFEEAQKISKSPYHFSTQAIQHFLELGYKRVENMRHSTHSSLIDIEFRVQLDVVSVAQRLHAFFSSEDSEVIVRPQFQGCGWVNAADGDVLSGITLFEIKAGERHFRLPDLRQLLCYCALNFSSEEYDIRKIALLNPRSGTLIKEDLNQLCQKISGTNAPEVLGEIVSFMSEPVSRYHSS